MSGWPWPLDGVQKWFESLWNWVSTAAVNAVKVVEGWVNAAVSGLSKTVTDWFDKIWGWISNAVNTAKNAIGGFVDALWTKVTAAFDTVKTAISGFVNDLWTKASAAFTVVQTAISGFVDALWTKITDAFATIQKAVGGFVNDLWTKASAAFDTVWSNVKGAVGGVWTSVSGAFGDLWTKTTGFLTTFWNDVSASVGAVGSAISSGFSGFTNLVGGLLSGFATAMGTALQSAVTAVTSGVSAAATAIMHVINQDVITPLMGALNWVLSSVSDLFRGFYDSFVNTLRGLGLGSPEGAAVLSVPLLLTSISAVFVMGVLGAVGDIHVMGCGINLSSLTNQLVAAFGITHLASAVISPILNAAYSQPVKYYWDSVFRPAIVSTGQADQMFFEENITEDQWHQVYAYHGWKEADIAAWEATMWREPSVLVLRGMASDPGTDMVWVRKKLRENGLIGEDADAVLAYGKRAALKDERNALATQIETDYRNNVIEQAEATADLTALAFMPEEVAFKIQKVQFLIARDARAAALKASAIPVSKLKSLTEAEIDMEFKLGLSTPEKYVQNLMDFGFSQSAARRKYAIAVTPKPLTAAEKTRQIDALNDKIAKAHQRYGYQLARQDLNVSFYSDMIDYLSSLEKPPETRIVQLTEQITKAAGEKQLILQEENDEVADLQGQLEVLGAG